MLWKRTHSAEATELSLAQRRSAVLKYQAVPHLLTVPGANNHHPTVLWVKLGCWVDWQGNLYFQFTMIVWSSNLINKPMGISSGMCIDSKALHVPLWLLLTKTLKRAMIWSSLIPNVSCYLECTAKSRSYILWQYTREIPFSFVTSFIHSVT